MKRQKLRGCQLFGKRCKLLLLPLVLPLQNLQLYEGIRQILALS